MGVDFVDYDNDGWPDAIINALAEQRYSLYRNVSGDFEYHSEPSGVSSITLMHSGWGMKFIDYDNDGWKDVFVAQGHGVDNVQLTKPGLRYKETLLLMRNVNGKFEDVSEQSGPPFRIPRAGRGAAFGDLDNDGFLDVAVNCNRESAVVLKNSGNSNHWLIVKTIGTVSNRDGIGAQLRRRLRIRGGAVRPGDDGRKLFVCQRPESPLRVGIGQESQAAGGRLAQRNAPAFRGRCGRPNFDRPRARWVR